MYQFFNTSGPCVPGKHYLVNPQDRLLDFNKINGLIKEERYFILHAPRQTGKTTQIGVKRQRQFFWSYIFEAVCPAQDKAVGLILPFANTKTMQMHLDEIAQSIDPGKHAVLFMDRAGWHTTKKLKTPSNLSLMPLPPELLSSIPLKTVRTIGIT